MRTGGQLRASLVHLNSLATQIQAALVDLYRVGESNISRRRIDTRLSALNTDWEELCIHHKSLVIDLALLSTAEQQEIKNDPYFSDEVFKVTRDSFLDNVEKMGDLLDKIDTAPLASRPSAQIRTTPINPFQINRLPRLDLPKFDGNRNDWLSFKDLFTALVINNDNLSQIEKLQYLKTSLHGTASSLLKHTPLVGHNFTKAWDDVVSFYDNKRILIDCAIHALFSLKPIRNESATALEDLYSTIQQNTSSVLLATAIAKLELDSRTSVRVRILVDPGSEVSLIAEDLVRNFNIPRQPSPVLIIGAGDHPSGKSKGSTILKLQSVFNRDIHCTVSCEILPKLTGLLPSSKIFPQCWPHLNGLCLADPSYCDPSPVDLILGSDAYVHIIQPGLKKGPENCPLAQSTIFGWIISGPTGQNLSSASLHSYHSSADIDLYELLERFWRQEEVALTKPTLSPLDQDCENLFQSTYTRLPSGKYCVRLPFKSSPHNLGESRSNALKILDRNSRRYASNNHLLKRYQDFLDEYQKLGHMTMLTSESTSLHPAVYLPHHGVLQHSGRSDKLRVVFNGSQKTSNGVALNDILHSGPKLQTDIFDVLLRFRTFRYVFTTDMKQMYRQVLVHPDDRKFQRILCKDSAGTLTTFELATVTYGLTCAPFLALRVVNQLITDEGDRFPLAITTMTKGRYVDDVLGGGDSIEETRSVAAQVDQLCKSGGFSLHKWATNHPPVLQGFSSDNLPLLDSLNLDESISVPTLGLLWQPSDDNFHFSPSSTSTAPITKRQILSTIAKIFDPLGLVAPVTLRAKSILQELWSIKIGWDETVPQNVARQWSLFIQQLPDLSSLKIPRWVGTTSTAQIEVHGFSDASLAGLAAVVYLRVETNSSVSVSLLCAKTKVAPIKRQTVPRLELSAALLLAKLISSVLTTLELVNVALYLWTDSSIVHAWVCNHPSKWKEYVHNRVCLIHELLPHAQWRLVPGLDNPADCASRGLNPFELAQHSLWWSGPSWLIQNSSAWPNPAPVSLDDKDLEKYVEKRSHVTQITVNLYALFDRFSSFTRLLRVVAICKRVLSRRSFRGTLTSHLTPEELENAKLLCVQQCQNEEFKDEVRLLKSGELLPRNHSLNRLTPFLDASGLLRVGGWLSNSNLSYDTKHPFILPKHSHLTTLIISDAHIRTLHGSTQSTLSFIRSTCWIIGGRSPIRSIISKCIRCATLRKITPTQLMGQLPSARVVPSVRPFFHSGVDYAGPFNLKTWSGRAARQYKGYLVLFVCMTTSALHLEVVTDYTAEAFLAAFHRFTSRRGICKTLTSDCGTNLKGADSELQRLFSASSYELKKFASLIAHDGTQWSFNPPAAPHFGGKWEAAVKSVKHHLRRIVFDRLLTYEEMSTIVSQIEAVLNSRPLCPLTDDPDDLSALTPGHFLIGHPLTLIPQPNLQDMNVNRLSRWKRIYQMIQQFWSKWSTECLYRYQSIYKWNRTTDNIKVGTLVLVVDERYPPSKWPLGRITEVHPGKDGLVRVATVKMQASIVTRPIVKLCPLPIPLDTL